MSCRIRYSPAALADADHIWDELVDFLGDYDKADAYLDGLADEIAAVRNYPKSGSPLYYGRLFTGYYWVLYNNHKLFYRLNENWIEVVRILHAHSDYMTVLFENEPGYQGDPFDS